jgi:hypothetical protein
MSGNGRGGFRGPSGRLRTRYDRLEPHERFKATLEAAARDDHDEHDALIAACPKKRYEMGDAAFFDRIDASRELAFPIALYLAGELGRLQMLTAGRELLLRVLSMVTDLCDEFADRCGEDDDRPDPADHPKVRALDRTAAEMRSLAAAVFEAFDRVCRDELGLDAETVLHAHLGPAYVATLGLDQLDDAKPHRKVMREWRVKLARKWQERIQG